MSDSNHIIPPLPEACQKVEDLLMDYAYGELDAAARREFDAHLSGCARCQGSVEAVMGTRKVMQVLSPEPAPSAGLESLLAYAEKEAERARAAASAKAPWWRSLRLWAGLVPVAGMAAAMLVVVTRQAESGTIVSQLAPPPSETPAVVEVAAAPDGKLKAEAQARPVAVAEEKKAEVREEPEEKEGLAAAAAPALSKDQPAPADSLAATGRSAPALAQLTPPKVTSKTEASGKNADGLLRDADFGGGGGVDGDRRQEQAKAKKSARFDAPEPSKAIADLETNTRRAPAPPGAAERQRVSPSGFATNASTDIGMGAGVDSFAKGSGGGAAIGSAAPERKAAPAKARASSEEALADKDDAPTAPPPPPAQPADEKRAAAKEERRVEAKSPAPEQPYVAEVSSAAPAAAPSPAPSAPSAVLDRAGPSPKPSAARPAAKADAETDPFAEGVRAANSGRFAEAVPLLQRAVAEHPSDPRAPGALFALAQAQGAQGDLAGALRSWEAFLSRFPGDGRAPEAAVRRAELLASLHRDSEYDAALSELQKRYPASPSVRRLLERESKANRAAEPAATSR